VQHHPSALSAFNRGDVIEIQGPPASGKTHLLYHLIITSIIPTVCSTTKLGGWDKAAVIFDTDGTFNIRRLFQLTVGRLARLFSADSIVATVNGTSVEGLARTVMKKVHVFRPTSSIQLAISLLQLPLYHMNHLPDEEIGFLAIDSISSFYWPDRFTFEQMNSSGNTARGNLNPMSPLRHVLASLQKIRLSHGPVIALTNWGITPLTKPTQNSALTTVYKQHLHPFPIIPVPMPQQLNIPYVTGPNPTAHSNPGITLLPPLTHQITLPFASITRFGPSISLDEAKEQESKYWNEFVTKCEVIGVVRTSGSARVGRFTCRIADEEVLVGDFGP
jgi:DNA-repair protein XRCC2